MAKFMTIEKLRDILRKDIPTNKRHSHLKF